MTIQKVKKPKPSTLQVVMTTREVELLEMLCEKINSTKSNILIECARRAIESAV